MLRYYVDEDIILSFLSFEDADALWRLIDKNRLYLREWLPWLDSVLQPQDAAVIISNAYELYNTDRGMKLGIWYNGELCGMIGFENINRFNGSASIGYWLGEEYQSKGIMTKACRRLIEIGFKDMKLNRVEIRCGEHNQKSRAIPQRLGLVEEGMLRDAEWLYDHYVNHYVFSVLYREWQEQQLDKA